MGTYFGDTSAVGDWRSRRLLVRSQIARGALTALPPSQRRFGIARLRESGRRAGAAVAHRRPQPPGASPPLPHIAAFSPWPRESARPARVPGAEQRSTSVGRLRTCVLLCVGRGVP